MKGLPDTHTHDPVVRSYIQHVGTVGCARNTTVLSTRSVLCFCTHRTDKIQFQLYTLPLLGSHTFRLIAYNFFVYQPRLKEFYTTEHSIIFLFLCMYRNFLRLVTAKNLLQGRSPQEMTAFNVDYVTNLVVARVGH